MSITLTYNGTTATLSDRLQWSDEFDWSPVEQATAYSTTGALLVDVAVKQAGQPITLEGTDTNAWISRALCDTLKAWAALPGAPSTLRLRGVDHAVLFDHTQGPAITARPLWHLADGEQQPDMPMRPTFRFITLG